MQNVKKGHKMYRQHLKRSIRRSIALRASNDSVYNEKRTFFEIDTAYKGFWKPKLLGWTVNSRVVEGASHAVIGGNLEFVVSEPISPVFPTKFGAYRWLAENIQDYEDVYYFINRKL